MSRVIMGANIAGIYGAQIFRSEDKPRYRRAFGICIGVLTLGLTLAVIRYIDERFRHRRNLNRTKSGSSSGESKSDLEKIPAAPPSDAIPQTVMMQGDMKPMILADPVK